MKPAISESFNSKYEYSALKPDVYASDWISSFKDVDGRDVHVRFLNQHRPTREWYEVSFSRDGEHGMTGGGDALKIFSTVLVIIYEFIKKLFIIFFTNF